jgi:hypothetical protein
MPPFVFESLLRTPPATPFAPVWRPQLPDTPPGPRQRPASPANGEPQNPRTRARREWLGCPLEASWLREWHGIAHRRGVGHAGNSATRSHGNAGTDAPVREVHEVGCPQSPANRGFRRPGVLQLTTIAPSESTAPRSGLSPTRSGDSKTTRRRGGRDRALLTRTATSPAPPACGS